MKSLINFLLSFIEDLEFSEAANELMNDILSSYENIH